MTFPIMENWEYDLLNGISRTKLWRRHTALTGAVLDVVSSWLQWDGELILNVIKM